MSVPIKILEIRTLGGFSLMVGERPFRAEWPEKITKLLFCTLLSPLDETITMEQLCRSLWEAPVRQMFKREIAAKFDQLSAFIAAETGINPLIIHNDGFGIDFLHVRVDAHEFFLHAVTGLKLISLGSHYDALINLDKADLLYRGKFLPGMDNRIIKDTREELKKLHRMVVETIKKME